MEQQQRSHEASNRKRPLCLQPPTQSLVDCVRFFPQDTMDENRSFMKRGKGLGTCKVAVLFLYLVGLCNSPCLTNYFLVSNSAEKLSIDSMNSGSLDRRVDTLSNELFNIVSTAQEASNLMSPSEREHATKRRVVDDSAFTSSCSAPELHNEVAGLKSNKTSDSEENSACTETTRSAADLPDPSTPTSPDEYLLLLAKAQLGVDFEIKAALSLKSFFTEVTEEQMAAYTMQVVGAVRNNDLDLLKKLHGEGQALDCCNRFGESLLNMACRRGFESIAQYLMASGTVDVRICDDGGRTPLHDACWNPSPQLAICRSIIEREPALLLVADRRGCTAFQYARQEHWNEWRKFLFENRNCLLKLKEPDTIEKFAKC
jgi:hypothetical protein